MVENKMRNNARICSYIQTEAILHMERQSYQYTRDKVTQTKSLGKISTYNASEVNPVSTDLLQGTKTTANINFFSYEWNEILSEKNGIITFM